MSYKQVLQFARSMRKKPTSAEKKFWSKVRGRNLYGLKFNRQFIIEHSNIMGNKYYYIADFHCFEKKLIIELDGEIHKNTYIYDKLREEVLIEMGYHVLRFTNVQVLSQWDEVANEIQHFIHQ